MVNKKQLTCKTGLKKNIITKKIFNREVTLCQKLNQENNGKCGWGKCVDCGVIPFLIKLHKGLLLEKSAEIKKAKEGVFKSS